MQISSPHCENNKNIEGEKIRGRRQKSRKKRRGRQRDKMTTKKNETKTSFLCQILTCGNWKFWFVNFESSRRQRFTNEPFISILGLACAARSSVISFRIRERKTKIFQNSWHSLGFFFFFSYFEISPLPFFLERKENRWITFLFLSLFFFFGLSKLQGAARRSSDFQNFREKLKGVYFSSRRANI